MDNDELIIKFGGDGKIKVETLTDFLEIYKELFYLINNQLGYSSEDLIIEVSPPENGSFKIKISPKYQKSILKSLGTILTGTLSGLLVYYVSSDNKDESESEVKTKLEKRDITNPEIQKNVYNIYQNTGATQKIQQTFIIVNSDENITDLKVNSDDKEIINIPKSQIAQIISEHDFTNNLVEEIPANDILKDEATLVVKTIHFEGQAKWAFVFRGYPIKALIKDKGFIEKLGDEAFRKGDTFKVILARKRYYDEDLQTYIVDQNSYVIEKVVEHISKKNNQSKLKLD